MVTIESRFAVSQRGTSLIEVLVAVVLILLGLLGLGGMHARLQTSEVESYQRSQALLLVGDMGHRLALNRQSAAQYAGQATAAAPLGAGMTCPGDNATLVNRDLAAWCAALQGASETREGGTQRVGAMIGGRGCIEELEPSVEYRVTVVWQGLTPLSAPPSSIACGVNQYDAADGSGCVEDRCRRYVTTIVRIANLGAAS